MTEVESSVGEMLRETADRLLQAMCDTATQRSADQGVWPAALWAAVEDAGLHRAWCRRRRAASGLPWRMHCPC